jgi:hypothetical protein
MIAIGLALVLLTGGLAGCGASLVSTNDDGMGISQGAPGKDSYVESTAEPPMAPDVAEEQYGEYDRSGSVEGVVTADADRMIIRTQTLRLEVESTATTIDTLRDLVSDHEGVITDLQVATDTDEWIYRYDSSGYATGDTALRGWVTVRVPAERLQSFTDKAMALGEVKWQSEGTQDVTQQYVDLSARLENLRVEEARMREFFDAAEDVEDMLAIERELQRVRGEIESMDAQVKYLERQAAMATVTIELTEPKPVVRPDGDTWGFRDAVTAGFRGAANVLTFAIAFIIATAPLWIVGIVAFFVVRWILRRRRAQRVGETPRQPEA